MKKFSMSQHRRTQTPFKLWQYYRDVPEIIFISHDASLTGAPILMLTLLAWWKQNGGPPFRIILRNGGKLEARFRELGRVWVLGWSDMYTIPSPTVQHDLLSFCGAGVRLIYANTAAVGDVLEALDPLSVPVVAHIHELETMLSRNIGPERFGLVKQRAKRFVVPSKAVADNLTTNHSVPVQKIDIVPEYLPDDYANSSVKATHNSLDPLTVLGAGTLDWRKGTDLFIQMARIVQRSCSKNVRYIWVGAATQPGQLESHKKLSRKHHVANVISFIGEQTDLRPFYRAADVFVSSSREDPYPVVCLEAAAHSLPIICFAGVGGMPEFVQTDAGRVVPHLDVVAMAEAVACMLSDSAARQIAGRCARKRIDKGHRISSCGKRLCEITASLLTDLQE